MKRYALLVCAALGLVLTTADTARAGWAWRRCMTCEEKRLQKFWHDYYCALKHYYNCLDSIDWVAYYKNHGYVINNSCAPCGPGGGSCGSCCPRVNYAPVFVSPCMQWAVPGSCVSGPPCGPSCGPAGCCGPMGCGN